MNMNEKNNTNTKKSEDTALYEQFLRKLSYIITMTVTMGRVGFSIPPTFWEVSVVAENKGLNKFGLHKEETSFAKVRLDALFNSEYKAELHRHGIVYEEETRVGREAISYKQVQLP